ALPKSMSEWLRLSAALLALSFIGYFSIDEWVNRPPVDEAQELAYLINGEIQSVELSGDCDCPAKHFRVLLNDAQLRELRWALAGATISNVPGHSIRTSRAKLTIKTPTSLLEYEAMVVK